MEEIFKNMQHGSGSGWRVGGKMGTGNRKKEKHTCIQHSVYTHSMFNVQFIF